MLTIRHLLETEALANSNATKVAELEDALFGALRDLIGDKTIATAAFEEDEVPMLEAACKRIGLLLSFRPTVTEMEENEREATTGWTLLFDLANRGSLGYQDEAVVRRAQHVLLWIEIDTFLLLFRSLSKSASNRSLAISSIARARPIQSLRGRVSK